MFFHRVIQKLVFLVGKGIVYYYLIKNIFRGDIHKREVKSFFRGVDVFGLNFIYALLDGGNKFSLKTFFVLVVVRFNKPLKTLKGEF